MKAIMPIVLSLFVCITIANAQTEPINNTQTTVQTPVVNLPDPEIRLGPNEDMIPTQRIIIKIIHPKGDTTQYIGGEREDDLPVYTILHSDARVFSIGFYQWGEFQGALLYQKNDAGKESMPEFELKKWAYEVDDEGTSYMVPQDMLTQMPAGTQVEVSIRSVDGYSKFHVLFTKDAFDTWWYMRKPLEAESFEGPLNRRYKDWQRGWNASDALLYRPKKN